MLADYHTGGREMNKREPAFPQNETSCQADWCPQGMTLRDYFAAKAIQGLVIVRTVHYERGSNKEFGHSNLMSESLATWAYEYADALLEERKK